MLNRLVKRTQEAFHEEGFLKTCLLGRKWLASRCRFFIYEPVCRLIPMQPSMTFEHEEGHPRIVVQIHLFYVELTDEMIEYTNRIPYGFDCYVSTDTEEKVNTIRRRFAESSNALNVWVQQFENRGRDIAPFILQLAPVVEEYDYLLHLHTKHSTHSDFGTRWRLYLLNSLLSSSRYIAALLAKMEQDKSIGLVFQRTFWEVKPSLGWKGNQAAGKELFKRMGIAMPMHKMPQFPAGNMFWGKTAAVLPIFHCGLSMKDFTEETKQVDGTLAHCIERCWGGVAASQGYKFLRVKL